MFHDPGKFSVDRDEKAKQKLAERNKINSKSHDEPSA